MAPFDDRLANLKLRPSIERLNQEAARSWARANVEVKKLGNHARFYPAFVQFHIEALVKHLEDIDRVFRDILALDGNTITPDFIRTQLMPRISMVIASRKGSITHEIDRHHQRPSDIQRGHHILATEINRLLGRIANHYEIEAIELGKSRNRVLAVKTQLPIAPQPSGLEIESILNNGVSRSKAGLWQGFHENFQNLANEETAQHAPGLPRFITAYFNYEKRPEILHVNGPGWLASTLFGKGVAIGGSDRTMIPPHGAFCLLDAPEHGLWMVSKGIGESLFERFQTNAARAAIALGCPPNTDAVDFWLHRLLIDLRGNKSELIFADNGETGEIVRACEASAVFCLRLERRELESLSTIDNREHERPKNTWGFDQESNFRHAMSQKTARVEQIERILGHVGIDVGSSSARRLIAEKQHLTLAVEELRRELDRLAKPVTTDSRTRTENIKPPKRLRSTVGSPVAVRKMEAYLESRAIGLTEFATRVGTTDRTLRAFRKSGQIRRDIFESIAKELGITKEDLLKDE